jgi:hypothetical protein
LDNTASPGYVRTQDGDSTVLQDVIDTAADGISTALNPEMSYCIGGLFNGATIDMARNSATKAAMVNIENHPAAFNEADANVAVKKVDTLGYNPAADSVATAGGVATTIMGGRYVLTDVNYSLYFVNTGANPLVDAIIESSPNNVNWAPLTWTTCDALAAGASCVYSVTGNSSVYIRARATAVGGSETTISAYYSTNKN